jgi:hypothetical protein
MSRVERGSARVRRAFPSAAFVFALLVSACAAPSNDPAAIDSRRCRMEGEAARMQAEQQEVNASPRMLMPNGAFAPTGGTGGGFAAYRQAYQDCLRVRATERSSPASVK